MIVVDRLTKMYGPLKAVDDFSFSASGGEVVGLIGPNGAGKTSTLKCMVGIQARRPAPSASAVTTSSTDAIEAKRRLAFMPDEPQLFEYLTVREHLDLVARLYNVDEPRRPRPRAARGTRADRQGERAARRALARHEAEAHDCLRPAARAAGAAVRRAAHRARSHRDPAHEADDRRPGAGGGGGRRVVAPAAHGRGDLHPDPDHRQGPEDRRRQPRGAGVPLGPRPPGRTSSRSSSRHRAYGRPVTP